MMTFSATVQNVSTSLHAWLVQQRSAMKRKWIPQVGKPYCHKTHRLVPKDGKWVKSVAAMNIEMGMIHRSRAVDDGYVADCAMCRHQLVCLIKASTKVTFEQRVE